MVVEFKAVNDPEETEDYEFVQDSLRQRSKDDGWVKAALDTIAANWLSWAWMGGN